VATRWSWPGRAADAPRDLAVTTKRTMRVTATQASQRDALEVEIRAQLASLESPAFAEPPGRAEGPGIQNQV